MLDEAEVQCDPGRRDLFHFHGSNTQCFIVFSGEMREKEYDLKVRKITKKLENSYPTTHFFLAQLLGPVAAENSVCRS